MDNLAKDEWSANNPLALKLEALTVREFVGKDLPARNLLMSPWLPVGGAAMIFGPAGAGKTQLCLSIAMAVATGNSLLDWNVPVPLNVLYIDGEMNPSDMQHRVAARLNVPGSDRGDRLQILSALLQSRDQEFINLAKQEHQNDLEGLVEQADLVIVDNLSALVNSADATENDAESWNALHRWMMDLRSRQKSVIFVHHSGKSGDQRGTSRRSDQLDTVIKLTDMAGTDGCRVKVEFPKHRGFYGRTAEPFIAEMTSSQSGQISWSRTSVDLAQEYRDLIDKGLSQQQVADKFGVNKSTVSRAIRK